MRDIVDTDGKAVKKGALLFDIKRKDKGKKKGIRATDHLGQKHTFYENERVFFSSERDQIRMFVYEFVRFVQFPVKVQAFVPHDFEDMIDGVAPTPETMIENFSILNFEKATEEATLVVNMDVANLDDYKNSVKYIMEVPVDLDIEVCYCECSVGVWSHVQMSGCVYMCIHVFACMCVCMCVCMYIHVCVKGCVTICSECASLCVCACKRAYEGAGRQACVRVSMCASASVHTLVCDDVCLIW